MVPLLAASRVRIIALGGAEFGLAWLLSHVYECLAIRADARQRIYLSAASHTGTREAQGWPAHGRSPAVYIPSAVSSWPFRAAASHAASAHRAAGRWLRYHRELLVLVSSNPPPPPYFAHASTAVSFNTCPFVTGCTLHVVPSSSARKHVFCDLSAATSSCKVLRTFARQATSVHDGSDALALCRRAKTNNQMMRIMLLRCACGEEGKGGDHSCCQPRETGTTRSYAICASCLKLHAILFSIL